MKSIEIFKKVLTEFNKQNVKYCVLRNYEFLLDPKQQLEFDFDITIQKQDIKKVEAIFKKFNFIKYPKQFSRKHQGFGKYIPEVRRKIGFDIQTGGIYWNDMQYLYAEQIIKKRIKKKFSIFFQMKILL